MAAVQVGFDADAPFAVEAGDGRAACGVADVGDGVQGDAAAVTGRNAQVFQGLDVVARVFGQGGADADLAAFGDASRMAGLTAAGVVVLAVMVIAFTLRKVVAAKSGEDEED